MKRKEIINELKKYFGIKELVCKHTYDRFGENSWQFLDTEYLHNLLVVRRDILKVGMVCNNWHSGGKYTQRGFRCNICQLVRNATNQGRVYLTAHANGCGGDFTPMGMTAEDARQKIKAKQGLLPYPMRLENSVSWLHMDTYDYLNGNKINTFNG
ncbi:MAG: hypothetical protein ACRC9P_06805 [Bacteroides sp.]